MAYAKRYKRKTPVRRYKKNTTSSKKIASICRSIVNKNIETKHSVFSTSDGTEISHNNFINITSDMLKTTQGTGDNSVSNTLNRVGDSINIRGLSMKMMIELNERYSDVTFRLIVVKSAKGDTPTRGTLFYGQSSNKMLDKINNERFTVIAQKYCKITAPNQSTVGAMPLGGSGTNYANDGDLRISRASKLLKIWIPANKIKRGQMTYESGSDQPKFFDYHVLLYAYSNYSTLQDTWNVGRLNDYIQELYYKDA